MNTNRKYFGSLFWAWILFAFILGAVVGFVTGVGAFVVLTAVTSYAPT
jgi:hypothetical protein